MDIDQLLKEKREEILRLASKHGASNVRVFGSVARGEAGPDSDVDFLVDVDVKRSILDLGRLQMELQELLDTKVDLVEPDGLHSLIKNSVLKEAVPL